MKRLLKWIPALVLGMTLSFTGGSATPPLVNSPPSVGLPAGPCVVNGDVDARCTPAQIASGLVDLSTPQLFNNKTISSANNTITIDCNTASCLNFPAGSPAFSSLTSSTNTAAAMVVGNGASIAVSGTGTNAATSAPLGGLTGLGTGISTFLATPTSAALAAALTDETGTGSAVFGTSPTLTTPSLGAATATSINGNIFTAGTYTLTGTAGKTLTFTNIMTLSGTDSTTMTFPGTSQTIAGLSTAQSWTAGQTFPASDLLLKGSSTGTDALSSFNAGASNFTTGVPAVSGNLGKVILQSGIPFILPSSGTIGNNCAITALTALRKTYPKAYIWMKTGAIATASTAGWYPFVGSSTTAGTCYNNLYTAGAVTWPGSPAAFSTTGPGAFTETIGSQIVGPSVTVPSNSLGVNGSLLYNGYFAPTSNSDVKQAFAVLGSTTSCTMFYTAGVNAGGPGEDLWMNNGVAGAQTCGATGANNGLNTAPTDGTNDTTTNLTASITLQIGTATDNFVLEVFSIIEYSN